MKKKNKTRNIQIQIKKIYILIKIIVFSVTLHLDAHVLEIYSNISVTLYNNNNVSLLNSSMN